MDVKEIIDVLDPKMKEYKEQVAAEAKKANEALEAEVKQLNEDKAKQGKTLAEIAEDVKDLKAKSGRILAGKTEQAENDFKSLVAKGIVDNFEQIKEDINSEYSDKTVTWENNP